MDGLHGAKNPTETECWVYWIVWIFLRKDSDGSGRHKHFRTSGLREKRDKGRQKHLVQSVLLLKIQQAAPGGVMLQKVQGEWGVSKDWNSISGLAVSLSAVPTSQMKSYTESIYRSRSEWRCSGWSRVDATVPSASTCWVVRGTGTSFKYSWKVLCREILVCVLTVFLNVRPLHSVQNCSSALRRSPLATAFFFGQVPFSYS